ncbi:MAG: thiamine pyrophosphate-dependent dehydrogenase E1 component subunit alpha [Nitriliruptoraceae bacterium]|nr:thiamine pyrophosphate-dependent dehydrogenase E1 component subunit alpha [Nitriliruptoraceae bacterium]
MSNQLHEHLATMLRIRAFEEACLEGVASGEIHGELHTAIGQEAIGAGMAGVLRDDDALVSTHRNHAHALAKGVPLVPMLAEIFERATGLCGGYGGHMHLFDRDRLFSTTGIVGATLPVALGHAYAMVLDGSDAVAVGVTGDGGVNTGGFHESLNLAGALALPLVVLVENNDLAISVVSSEVSAAGSVERAPAYAARGQRVDGTDPVAVEAAFRAAVDHARAGGGPSIVEATCHRFRGHYEGDPDLYRSAEEKDALTAHDPIARARRLLLADGATEAELDELATRARTELEQALAEVRAAPAPDPAGAHDHVTLLPTGGPR